MPKNWGFEKDKEKLSKKKIIFSFWKGSILFMIGISFLSFFSIVNEGVYANKKQLIKDLYTKYDLQTLSNLGFPSYIAKVIYDYKKGYNILKKDKNELNILQNKLGIFIQIIGFGKYKKNITNIINKFAPYKKDIYKILGENEKKNYLLIFENTSEERANGGFIGSFMKISLSGGHIINYKIYDAYKVFYDICKKQNPSLTGKQVFLKCNNSAWSLKNNYKPYNKIFKTTTFINSNIFGFTDINGKNIVNHFKNAYGTKINGVFFIKSNILKYLFLDGEKLLWNLEITNYKNLVKYKNGKNISIPKNKNIVGEKGVKAKYLEKVNNLLKNKKQIFTNFITNYNKIIQNGIIQAYLPESSKKFQEFLKQENLNFYQKKGYAYLFFYNLGFNKTSKFIDHIITVNTTTYVNPINIKLNNGINIIKYKNILNTNPKYYDYLIKNNIPKSSYLWSKQIIYKNVLILPKQCKTTDNIKDTYVVMCDF